MHKLRKGLIYGSAAVVGLVIFALTALLIVATTVELTGEQRTPAGYGRSESHYVDMRDETKIAVEVWFPPDIAVDQKVPTLVRATRYGRAQNIGLGVRVLVALGRMSADPNLQPDVRTLNAAGYAVVRVDARGSGASFGHRPVEWSQEEVADYGEVIDWITRQPWSNGRVGAYGVSYDGNAAELIAVTHHPALKAVAPMFSYFDPFQDLIRPGGVFDAWFIERWSAATASMDTRLPCRRQLTRCWREKFLSDGIKPVAADPDGRLRAAAERNNPRVLDSFEHVEFRDDIYGVSGGAFDERAPYRHADAIAASGVAMNVWAGWYDSAAVDGALARYASVSTPQVLIIGPLTHGGKFDSSPYAPVARPVQPSFEDQYRTLASFFDPLLQENRPAADVQREIRYYTLGEDAWKSTQTWPPAGIANVRWYFGSDASLTPSAPTDASAFDRYAVDFSATTGARSRWHTIGGPDVVYADRRDEDRKLLTYTSAPLEQAIEVTGNPLVTLNLEATQPDAALHVYLEDVSPDGRVTYLTEGILRAANRRISTEQPPYRIAGPYHSLRRADVQPLTPGAASEVVVALYAISARVPAGHRIRIAVAGANADVFERIPANGDVTLTVHRSRLAASFVDLPQR